MSAADDPTHEPLELDDVLERIEPDPDGPADSPEQVDAAWEESVSAEGDAAEGGAPSG
jgi:hypothetical protein